MTGVLSDVELLGDYYDLIETGWATSPDEMNEAEREAWGAAIIERATADGLRVSELKHVETLSNTAVCCGCSAICGVVELRTRNGLAYPPLLAQRRDIDTFQRLITKDWKQLPKLREQVGAELDALRPGWRGSHVRHD